MPETGKLFPFIAHTFQFREISGQVSAIRPVLPTPSQREMKAENSPMSINGVVRKGFPGKHSDSAFTSMLEEF